jgi:hypothetical protein
MQWVLGNALHKASEYGHMGIVQYLTNDCHVNVDIQK